MNALEFRIEPLRPFEWSRIDVISPEMTFERLMIKLQHTDRAWREGVG